MLQARKLSRKAAKSRELFNFSATRNVNFRFQTSCEYECCTCNFIRAFRFKLPPSCNIVTALSLPLFPFADTIITISILFETVYSVLVLLTTLMTNSQVKKLRFYSKISQQMILISTKKIHNVFADIYLNILLLCDSLLWYVTLSASIKDSSFI